MVKRSPARAREQVQMARSIRPTSYGNNHHFGPGEEKGQDHHIGGGTEGRATVYPPTPSSI